MSSTLIAILTLTLLLPIFGIWFDKHTRKNIPKKPNNQSQFSPSKWIYIVFLGVILISLTLAIAGILEGKSQASVILSVIIGSVGTLLPLYGIWHTSMCCLILMGDKELLVIGPFTKKTIPIKEIKSLKIENNLLILDLGKIPRTAISLYFKGMPTLIRNLEEIIERNPK